MWWWIVLAYYAGVVTAFLLLGLCHAAARGDEAALVSRQARRPEPEAATVGMVEG